MKKNDVFSLCVKCKTIQFSCATFEVMLFDNEERLVGKKRCNNNQNVYFYVNEKAVYRLKVKVIQNKDELTPESITKWVGLEPNRKNSQVFLFNNYSSFFHKRFVKVNFELTDYFYPRLPIEKGELILWHNTM